MCEAPFVCPKCSGWGSIGDVLCPVCRGERLIWPNPDVKNCVHTLQENGMRSYVRKDTSGPYSRVQCPYCPYRPYRIRLPRHKEVCLFNPANDINEDDVK